MAEGDASLAFGIGSGLAGQNLSWIEVLANGAANNLRALIANDADPLITGDSFVEGTGCLRLHLVKVV